MSKAVVIKPLYAGLVHTKKNTDDVRAGPLRQRWTICNNQYEANEHEARLTTLSEIKPEESTQYST